MIINSARVLPGESRLAERKIILIAVIVDHVSHVGFSSQVF